MTSPEALERPAWVFWSTRESIDNDIPSVTAIAETIIAIPLYWWIAIYFETYALLLVSVIVAPLVLLRSDQSVELGVKWFMAWENQWGGASKYEDLERNERILVVAIVVQAPCIAGAASYLLAAHFLAASGGWSAFWGGLAISLIAIVVVQSMIIVGVLAARAGVNVASVALMSAVLGTVVGVTSGAGIRAGAGAAVLIVAVPFGLALALQALVVSLAVRIGATLRHLYPGIRSLPRNYRRLVLCTSPRQEPELVPGLSPMASRFSFTIFLRLFRRIRETPTHRVLLSVFLPLAMILWFLPGWLYRVTLKSTAWFWWPLAYLGGDVQRAKNPEEFRRATMGTLWAMASIAIAVVTLIGFVWVNFVQTGAAFERNPLLTVVGYIFVVDWKLPPWQFLTVMLAVLSLAIVFLLDDGERQYRLAVKQENLALQTSAERKLRWTEHLARVRFLLLVLFLVIAGGQALLYFNSRNCTFSVPPSIERQAQWLYGDRMPRCAAT